MGEKIYAFGRCNLSLKNNLSLRVEDISFVWWCARRNLIIQNMVVFFPFIGPCYHWKVTYKLFLLYKGVKWQTVSILSQRKRFTIYVISDVFNFFCFPLINLLEVISFNHVLTKLRKSKTFCYGLHELTLLSVFGACFFSHETPCFGLRQKRRWERRWVLAFPSFSSQTHQKIKTPLVHSTHN